MESVISLKSVSKLFYNKKDKKLPEDRRKVWALGGLTLEVNRGEIFGLLGPNGAGKTTAIRCIAGILRPTSGKIFVNGMEVNREQAHKIRRGIGFLSENPGNYENLTLLENLRFFGSFYKLKNLNQRIDDVLEMMGLLNRKNMKAGKLSKGQKQRLAIARTILHDPDILFFDEPTAGLDPVASVKVRNLILRLKRNDRTIFINSHNLEEVQKVCDRVAILDLGKLNRLGTPDELGRQLWDSQEIVFTLREQVSPKIETLLSSLKYIKQYNVKNNQLFIYTEDINETTPEIIKELVKLDANILEVNKTVHSLEDIYLKLMDEESLNIN